MSMRSLKWLRPRGVEMNAAHPSLASTMGLIYAHALGLANANSENVTPATPAPTRLLYRSDPTHCHVEPFLKRMNISWSLVLARRSIGNAWSMRLTPVIGSTAVQMAFLAWEYSGRQCQYDAGRSNAATAVQFSRTSSFPALRCHAPIARLPPFS